KSECSPNSERIYNRTFQYKMPEYAIRSKEDLLNHLRERQEKVGVSRGMPYKELDDCINLTNAIMELESEGKVMVIRLMKVLHDYCIEMIKDTILS
ncbi:3983_t:CDS:2, partial [Diversispora eburnea]